MSFKSLIFLLICLTIKALAIAQTNNVVFDYDKTSLNENQPLPAEKHFTITGAASSQVTMVEIAVFSEKSRGKQPPLYQSLWKRSANNQNTQFYLPINYKLRGNEQYDLEVRYYRQATGNEIQNLRNDLFMALEAYLRQNLVLGKSKLSIRNPANKMLNDLNTLVKTSLLYYKNQAEIPFAGFSDLVKEKLRIIEQHSLGPAQRLFAGKSKKEANILQRDQFLEELKALIFKEVAYLINTGMNVIGDSKVVDNATTEKTPNFLTVHLGYSGTAFYENDETFLSGLNAGITIPWGKQNLAKAFWRKSALVAGVYVNNFKAGDETISGPIIGRPFYIGLGYKVVPFVRLTAGATFLETGKNINGNQTSLFGDKVHLKPFVGVAIDFDLWFNLRK
ncbi:MAG: hypothetical protein MUE85_18310 [Microscillaceae bacterium]|jgi:hypothetical protein|nr:hypothetical protein [Microscillaceae bacterium]